MHRMSWFGCVLACTVVAAEATLADAQAGDGGCSPLSCRGYCGGQAPGGCWCDELCCSFIDCCSDVFEVCGTCTTGSPIYLCEGLCGAQSDWGCWCDEACCIFEDCCWDKLAWCGGCNPVVPNSCVMRCGTKASAGCWCDECCCDLGDCCADKFQICGGCNLTGRGGGPADINNDLAVNMLDLLAVISTWGPCTIPPAHECAEADVAPHPNGDRSVNVNDLLMVINNWG